MFVRSLFGGGTSCNVKEPVFGQVLQGSSGKAFYSLGVNEIFDSFLIPLGPGDLLAHHAISLALHVTSLIVLKGSLDGCGSFCLGYIIFSYLLVA